MSRHVLANIGVLMYHRIAEPRFDPWELSVSPEHFDEHLAQLCEIGSVVGLAEALDVSPAGRLRRNRPTFALTFDDGYVDNLRAGVPVLEKYDLPATVFVAVGFLDRDSYWWDTLDVLLLDPTHSVEQVAAAAQAAGAADADLSGCERTALHEEVYLSLVVRPIDEIRTVLDHLASALSVAPPVTDGRPMTTDEFLELADHPLITIGGHTIDHPQLAGVPRSVALTQIEGGRRRIFDLTGEWPDTFAYPYGHHDLEVARLTEAIGFGLAVTTEEGWVGLRDDHMRHRRLSVPDVAGDQLWATLADRGLSGA